MSLVPQPCHNVEEDIVFHEAGRWRGIAPHDPREHGVQQDQENDAAQDFQQEIDRRVQIDASRDGGNPLGHQQMECQGREKQHQEQGHEDREQIASRTQRHGLLPSRQEFPVPAQDLRAEQHRDLLLAISAAGHQFINGTYHGTSFTGASTGRPPLTTAERSLELSRTEVTVYHLTGRSTRPYWRPPHGDIDEGARRDAASAGYTIAVTGTIDTGAWPGATPDAVVARTVEAALAGSIVIMHTDAASPDAGALPCIITGLRARGFTFVTIGELLGR